MRIETLEKIRTAIEGKKEFKIVDKGDYIVVDYVFQTADTFDQEILLECRGIKFNPDGSILARPFKKFFNHGEKGHFLDATKEHYILDKLDGSMIHPALIKDELVLMTRMGRTDVAEQAEKEALQPKHKDFMVECVCQYGKTPIFEYTSPNNRIVIPYSHPQLTLLAIRDNVTGAYTPTIGVRNWAQKCGIQTVNGIRQWQSMDDVESFLEMVKELKGKEGFVVVYEDGYRLKVKAEEYVLQHRAKESITTPKRLFEVVRANAVDDVLPLLGDEDKAYLNRFVAMVERTLDADAALVETLVAQSKARSDSRKEFALEVKKREKGLWPILFQHMDGRPARECVLMQKGYLEEKLL